MQNKWEVHRMPIMRGMGPLVLPAVKNHDLFDVVCYTSLKSNKISSLYKLFQCSAPGLKY